MKNTSFLTIQEKKTLEFKFNFPFSINFVPYVEKLPITIKPTLQYGLDFEFWISNNYRML